MPVKITEKPKSGINNAELKERVKIAATRKFLLNLTDAEVAKEMNVSVYTIAEWKQRKEWMETVRQIAIDQIGDSFHEVRALAPYARKVLSDVLRDGPEAARLKVAQYICDISLTKL